jgi:cytoskeleton protein RodZ
VGWGQVEKVTLLSTDKADNLDGRRLHLREISPDVNAPLETVGQDLNTARKRKGDDLTLVSRRLKIRKNYLNALEESNFDLLPGRTYAVGFVRSYSQYLGLQTNSVVERYKTEIAGYEDVEEPELCLAPKVERKFPQGTTVFIVLLLISVVYGGYQLQTAAKQMLNERETAIPARLEAVASDQPVTDTAPTLTQSELVSATAVLRPIAKFKEPANNEFLAADIRNALQNLPVGDVLGLRNGNSRITLRIHETTSLRIVGSNDTLFINRTLSPGDTYRAPDVAGMRISAADSGAVELLVDGKPSGFLGARGAEANALSLNLQDIVDRAQ